MLTHCWWFRLVQTSQTIKQQAEEKHAEQDRLAQPSKLDAPDEDEAEEAEVPVEESLRPIFDRYTRLLTTYLGPAASVIVDDAIDVWKKTYLQTPDNLPHLIAILEKELDSKKERQAFSAKAAVV